ncbi:sensor histidine kinase [Paenibacillaceae bacterium]|nr:sensor histidine kinase [Paenibacillaceae bacterium]
MLFLAVIIVPFLLFAYYSHNKSIEGISSTNTKMTKSYLQQAKKNFDIYLSVLNEQVNDLIGNPVLQDMFSQEPVSVEDEERLSLEMLSFLYSSSTAVDAFRLKLYPMKPASYLEYLKAIDVPADIEDQDWFRRSRLNQSPSWYLFMPKKGDYNKPLLSYVKRFTGLYDPVPRGLIVVDLSEDYLSRYFSPSDQFQSQKLLLLNENGSVYYDSETNEWTGQLFPSSDYISYLLSGAADSYSITINGIVYLATHVKMDSQPWFMVSLTPLGELTGAIEETNRVMVMFLVGYLLCCAGLIVYITMKFTQPIARLVRQMRRIEAHNLKYPLPASNRKDEIGWLYREVGALVQKIKGLIEEASLSERKKKELEFRVLSHQINPHFLYNTLESIRWKAENHGQNDIGEMVSALGNLLRLSLNQGKEITTLRREIEQVKAYVQIEQARMGKKVRIFYFCDKELLDRPFLRLLLQPLVENAIQHSVREDFDKGKIVIDARREQNNIILSISDNGNGIPESVLGRMNLAGEDRSLSTSDLKGVGLINVNDRLRLYFGDAYQLQIDTGPEKGTRITIRHPILEEDEVERLQLQR